MNFPFICSSIPAAHAYGVYISQLIRYSTVCGSYHNFLDIGLLLTWKLLDQVLRSPPWLGWPLWNICVTNDHGYVSIVVTTSRSFPRLWPIIWFETRLPWRVSLVEQEQLTPPEHLTSLPVFSGVPVTRSLVLYICFVDRCLSFCAVFLSNCFVCSSTIYGFWLPLWYLYL